jgi:hypothetical protein
MRKDIARYNGSVGGASRTAAVLVSKAVSQPRVGSAPQEDRMHPRFEYSRCALKGYTPAVGFSGPARSCGLHLFDERRNRYPFRVSFSVADGRDARDRGTADSVLRSRCSRCCFDARASTLATASFSVELPLCTP